MSNYGRENTKMSNYGMYPAALVEKYGLDKMRNLLKPGIKKPKIQKSRRRSVQEKVVEFVAKHEKFRVWMCARGCSEKADVVLPVLMVLPNLQISESGLCIKISRGKHTKKGTKKGDR